MKFNQVGVNRHPVETEHDLWINGDMDDITLADILEKVKEKWGEDVDLNSLTIQPVHHHEYSVGYDLHDPSDYVNYIYIDKN